MAALNFPASPSVDDLYTANGSTWKWDGTSWNVVLAPSLLSLLDDVTITTVSTGQVLKYDGAEWVNDTDASGFTTIVTATSTTASAGDHIHVTAATQTITLPASPTAGDRVAITVENFTDTVVARNGNVIMDLSEDFTIDVANMGITLIYTDATNGWRLL
jgi:hypothetical protein